METLVQYKRMLIKVKPNPDRSALVSECRVLLKTLKTIDPMRGRRYDELGAS
jgi:hypothetical protein